MNVIRFIKDWTLAIAIAVGAAIYLTFAFTPELSDAADFFAPILDAMLPMFMFLVLFVTFCKVDFKKLRIVPWHLWVSAFQILTVALISGIVIDFDMTGNSLVLMEAMLLCIIGPCAAAAAVVVKKIGGNMEQMTTYTFLSNFITAILIPICFPLIDNRAEMSFWESFALILYKVCMVLVVPMLLAYIVKHWMKRLHRAIISVKDLAYYMWCGSLMIVTGTTVKNIVHADTTWTFLVTIAIVVFVLCLMQFAVGKFIGHYFDNAINAGQALGQKNTAFAIWIAYTYLNPLSSVGPGCYILWQNIINSIEIWAHERRQNRTDNKK